MRLQTHAPPENLPLGGEPDRRNRDEKEMKRVFIHAGHSKTGSSFIQAVLARNAATLRARSLHYPRGGNFQAAENFEISAGNFRFKDIMSNPARFDAITREGENIVLSSEYFFHEIAASDEPLLFFTDRGFDVR